MAEEAEPGSVARRLAGYIGVGLALIVVIVAVMVGIAVTRDVVLWLVIGAGLGFALGALTALGQQRRDRFS